MRLGYYIAPSSLQWHSFPGSVFFAAAQESGNGFRLNFTVVSEEKIERGLEILGEVLRG